MTLVPTQASLPEAGNSDVSATDTLTQTTRAIMARLKLARIDPEAPFSFEDMSNFFIKRAQENPNFFASWPRGMMNAHGNLTNPDCICIKLSNKPDQNNNLWLQIYPERIGKDIEDVKDFGPNNWIVRQEVGSKYKMKPETLESLYATLRKQD